MLINFRKYMTTKTLTKTRVRPVTTMIAVIAAAIAGVALISSSLPLVSTLSANSTNLSSLPVEAALAGNGTIYYVDSSIIDTNVASATPDFTTRWLQNSFN